MLGIHDPLSLTAEKRCTQYHLLLYSISKARCCAHILLEVPWGCPSLGQHLHTVHTGAQKRRIIPKSCCGCLQESLSELSVTEVLTVLCHALLLFRGIPLMTWPTATALYVMQITKPASLGKVFSLLSDTSEISVCFLTREHLVSRCKSELIGKGKQEITHTGLYISGLKNKTQHSLVSTIPGSAQGQVRWCSAQPVWCRVALPMTGVGNGWYLRSLPTYTVQWFCELAWVLLRAVQLQHHGAL